MTEQVMHHRTYVVTVRPAFRAECESPITGELLVAYSASISGARREIDLQILREANERELTIVRDEDGE